MVNEDNFGKINAAKYETKRTRNKLLFGSVNSKSNKWNTNRNKGDVIEYSFWSEVMRRCLYQNFKDKHPEYADVSCDSRWLSFDSFMEDVSQLPNFDKIYLKPRWCLDKDLLIRGNKIYRKDAVCFIPQQMNSMLTTSKRARGDLPIGVFLCRNKTNPYRAMCGDGYKGRIYIGDFKTPEMAFEAYKERRKEVMISIANKWQHLLPENVYDAFVNWEINITD